MSTDFLPGDGSIAAIRAEHETERAKLIDGRPGSSPLVNPYIFARVAALLAEIDRLDHDEFSA